MPRTAGQICSESPEATGPSGRWPASPRIGTCPSSSCRSGRGTTSPATPALTTAIRRGAARARRRHRDPGRSRPGGRSELRQQHLVRPLRRRGQPLGLPRRQDHYAARPHPRLRRPHRRRVRSALHIPRTRGRDRPGGRGRVQQSLPARRTLRATDPRVAVSRCAGRAHTARPKRAGPRPARPRGAGSGRGQRRLEHPARRGQRHTPTLTAAVDGEPVDIPAPVEIASRAAALRMRVPRHRPPARPALALLSTFAIVRLVACLAGRPDPACRQPTLADQ